MVPVPTAADTLFRRVMGNALPPKADGEGVQMGSVPSTEVAPAPGEGEAKKPKRNTRHPTTKPLDKPKPTGQSKPRRTRHVAHTVRDVKIVISLSREEASIWHDCAKREGRSMSEWVRRTVFDVARIAQRPHPERDVAMGAIDVRNNKL